MGQYKKQKKNRDLNLPPISFATFRHSCWISVNVRLANTLFVFARFPGVVPYVISTALESPCCLGIWDSISGERAELVENERRRIAVKEDSHDMILPC
jgi:hypothetical protein